MTMKIGTILHPTDFSRNSEAAFHMACALARDYGARLAVVHVKPLPTVAYGEFGALPPEATDHLEELKERLARVQPTDSSIRMDRFVVEGEIAWEILRMAGELKADLIVMGTHGRSGLGRLLMGSVAEMVVRKATCPVLTVKHPVPEEAKELAGSHEAVATA
jgi:nucleotide-binding universal stress UspA family protein